MSLLVTGTVGIDTVETPFGKAPDVLGGSAVYFSFAAGLLTPVRLVAVVGDDFPEPMYASFGVRPIDMSGLERRAGAKTFRWHGKYVGDMNSAETILTALNVIGEDPPTVPDSFRDSEYIFLANTHPALQRAFIDQLPQAKLIVCDTMNLWINEFRDELVKTLARVHGVVLNDGEARLLTGEMNLIRAGREVLNMGPRFVIIKKGEHGSLLIAHDELFVLPAFPSTAVKDPTGAGDSFAGGMMGYLAANDRMDNKSIRAAMAHGTCIASITIEGFSLDSLKSIDRKEVDARLKLFRSISAWE